MSRKTIAIFPSYLLQKSLFTGQMRVEGVIHAASHFGMMEKPTLSALGPVHSPREMGGLGVEQPMILPNGVTARKVVLRMVRHS